MNVDKLFGAAIALVSWFLINVPRHPSGQSQSAKNDGVGDIGIETGQGDGCRLFLGGRFTPESDTVPGCPLRQQPSDPADPGHWHPHHPQQLRNEHPEHHRHQDRHGPAAERPAAVGGIGRRPERPVQHGHGYAQHGGLLRVPGDHELDSIRGGGSGPAGPCRSGPDHLLRLPHHRHSGPAGGHRHFIIDLIWLNHKPREVLLHNFYHIFSPIFCL